MKLEKLELGHEKLELGHEKLELLVRGRAGGREEGIAAYLWPASDKGAYRPEAPQKQAISSKVRGSIFFLDRPHEAG